MAQQSEGLGEPHHVGVLIDDSELRQAVVHQLSGANIVAIVPDSGQDPRRVVSVLVCDAILLPPGLTPAGSKRYVAIVHGTTNDARRVLAAGAAGIVFTHDLVPLVATLRAVSVGQLAVPITLRAAVVKPVLTNREKQILAMVVLGLSNREIADRLVLAESTVKSHLFSAFRRLGVRTRKEAIALILDKEQGLGSGILTITQ